MIWSTHLQPPEYLRATRFAILPKAYCKIIANKCNIFDNSIVLDVGCGTGCFSKYLSFSVQNVDFIGVDKDYNFIANQETMYGNNNFKIIHSDAYDLPFDENFFDSVISHTLFNCVNWPDLALQEMIRVTKIGGTISSLLPISFAYESYFEKEGNYINATFIKELNYLEKELENALSHIGLSSNKINCGLNGLEIPSLFRKNLLINVSILPVGCAFSLSDNSLDIQEKKFYIENLYLGKIKKINNLQTYPDFQNYFDLSKIENYKKLLKEKKEYYLCHLNDNDIWEIISYTSLLVCGQKEKRNVN